MIQILTGAALIGASIICLALLRRAVCADMASDAQDQMTGGLVIFLPLYACAGATALGLWLIADGIGGGA